MPEHPLGRGQVEPGQGRAEQAVGLAEADDADQRERLPAVLEHDVDPVAELEARPSPRCARRCATSSAPDGVRALPVDEVTRRAGGRRRSAPNVGAPPGWIGLAVLVQDEREAGDGALGDRHARDRPHLVDHRLVDRAQPGRRSWRCRASNAASDLTTTSVPDVRPAYSSSNALTMVSESTKVPDTKATPTVTAAMVRNRRSLLTRRLRSETLSMVSPPAVP